MRHLSEREKRLEEVVRFPSEARNLRVKQFKTELIKVLSCSRASLSGSAITDPDSNRLIEVKRSCGPQKMFDRPPLINVLVVNPWQPAMMLAETTGAINVPIGLPGGETIVLTELFDDYGNLLAGAEFATDEAKRSGINRRNVRASIIVGSYTNGWFPKFPDVTVKLPKLPPAIEIDFSVWEKNPHIISEETRHMLDYIFRSELPIRGLRTICEKMAAGISHSVLAPYNKVEAVSYSDHVKPGRIMLQTIFNLARFWSPDVVAAHLLTPEIVRQLREEKPELMADIDRRSPRGRIAPCSVMRLYWQYPNIFSLLKDIVGLPVSGQPDVNQFARWWCDVARVGNSLTWDRSRHEGNPMQEAIDELLPAFMASSFVEHRHQAN